jgi:tubulin alpha
MTNTVLQPSSQLFDMYKLENKIAISLFYRGQMLPFEVMRSLDKIKTEKPGFCCFEEWSPLGFKVTVNDFSLRHNKRSSSLSSPSCCSLTSSLEFTFPLAHQNHKFDILYAKRAFVHHFIKHGLEEQLMSEAREDLAAL